ncbi:hypothetical protein ScPMuIL_013676 [Solemya velum]
MTTKIFIGNLSSETQSADLRQLFQKFGKVAECDVLRNYGFVHMDDSGEAKSAIAELDGYSLHGNRMRVELSTGKSGSGRGGRGRGRGGSRFGGGGGGGRPPADPYYRPYPYDDYRRPYPPRPGDRYPPTSRPPYDDRYGRIPPPPERDERYRYPYPEERRMPGRYDDRMAAYERTRTDPYYRDRSPMGRPPPDYYRREPSLEYRGEAARGYPNGYDSQYGRDGVTEYPPAEPAQGPYGHSVVGSRGNGYTGPVERSKPPMIYYSPQAPASQQPHTEIRNKDSYDQSFLQTGPIFF